MSSPARTSSCVTVRLAIIAWLTCHLVRMSVRSSGDRSNFTYWPAGVSEPSFRSHQVIHRCRHHVSASSDRCSTFAYVTDEPCTPTNATSGGTR